MNYISLDWKGKGQYNMKRGLQTSAQLWTGSSWENDLAVNMGYFLWNWKDNSEGATKRPGCRVERYRDLFPSIESQSRHCQLMLCYTNFYRPKALGCLLFLPFLNGSVFGTYVMPIPPLHIVESICGWDDLPLCFICLQVKSNYIWRTVCEELHQRSLTYTWI